MSPRSGTASARWWALVTTCVGALVGLLLAGEAFDDSREDVVMRYVGGFPGAATLLVVAGLAGAAVLAGETRRRRLRPSARVVIRGLLTRRPLDEALDWFRFRLDTFPRSMRWLQLLGLPDLQSASYQELPWLGLTVGRRAEATRTRWERMRPLIEELGVESAIDLGANVGSLTFKLAEAGIPSIAVERVPRLIRTSLYARRKLGNPRASILVMDLTLENFRLLPHADCVLLLSVWHHLVREQDQDNATAMLVAAWERTRRVLFFDTGEGEMPRSWGLPPMEPDPRTWLERYLAASCRGSRIIHLGLHDALGPNDEISSRNLFAVVRNDV